MAGDGTLWIGTLKGLASWKDFRLTRYPEVAGQIVGSLLQDHEGTVRFGSYGPSEGRLCAIRGGKVECNGAGIFGRVVLDLYEDHGRNLWVLAQTGLWRLSPGLPERYAFPQDVAEADSLTEDDNGTLLLATTGGVRQLVGGKIQPYTLPGVEGYFRPNSFFRSSDASL